jgi:hypothetical protein
MIYLLRIGHTEYALKSDVGISTIMRVLSGSARVKVDHRYCGEGIELDQDPVKCSLEVLPDFNFTTRKKAKVTVVEPEVLPADRISDRPRYGSGILDRAIAKGQLRISAGGRE